MKHICMHGNNVLVSFPLDAGGGGALLLCFSSAGGGILVLGSQPRLGELGQQLGGGVGEDEDVPLLGVDEALLDALVEQREQAVVVAVHVEQPHLVMQKIKSTDDGDHARGADD